MNRRHVLSAWRRILAGSLPMLSIEITRECPATAPPAPRASEFRGDELVRRVLALVRRHRPLHVSLVGGEPLLRRAELDRILPALSAGHIWAMVVTTGALPIPAHWLKLPGIAVAVTVDDLPQHHHPRGRPASYDRILENIAGRIVKIHLTLTRPMLEAPGDLEAYFAFWNARPEVAAIWVSAYTPQIGEATPAMLTPAQRLQLVQSVGAWAARFPRITLDPRTAVALANPPAAPAQCAFARLSASYAADLASRIEPCVFGGTPDCSQCGSAIAVALHAIQHARVAGLLPVSTLVNASVAVGQTINRLRPA